MISRRDMALLMGAVPAAGMFQSRTTVGLISDPTGPHLQMYLDTLRMDAIGDVAIADSSGGSGNVAGDGYVDGNPPVYAAGPGDPCQYTDQCTNSQSFLSCDYNAYTDDYRCCTYEGGRCDWDGGCCGWLTCNDGGYCVG